MWAGIRTPNPIYSIYGRRRQYLNNVEDHGDADQGVELQQGEGVKQPPNANHDQKLGVQLKTAGQGQSKESRQSDNV